LTTTKKDLIGVLERLHRNTGILFSIKQYNGYYHLADNENQELSNGNSKQEIYYQIVTACKIIELMKNRRLEK
jgi:hypothetical protein